MDRRKPFINFLVIFVPLFLVVVFSVLTFYYSRTDANYKVLSSSEKNRIQVLTKYLNADIEGIVSDLIFLSSLSHMYDQDQHENFKLKNELLQFSKAKKIYDQIRVLNTEGMETLRINYNSGAPNIVPEENFQNKKGRYYFEDTFHLKKGEIFVSPLDLNMEHGQIEKPFKPVIRFGNVLYNDKDEKTGILLLNYLALNLLERIVDLHKTSSGNSYLVNGDGYYLYAENPDITWGFMFPRQERESNSLVNDYPDAWNKINHSVNGQFETREGLYTFDTIFPMTAGLKSSTGSGYAQGDSSAQLNQQEYFWKLITFVPNHNLYSYDRSLKAILAYFLLAISAIIGFGSYRFSMVKQRSERAEEEVAALQGTIPICMYCKEIRDEEGAWNRLENYIETHSEAQFSHGICDTCMQKQFGDKKPC